MGKKLTGGLGDEMTWYCIIRCTGVSVRTPGRYSQSYGFVSSRSLPRLACPCEGMSSMI